VTEPPPTRLPVTVLTGFLGSGKTTLLNALLRRSDLKDTAVIVNELGEIGLDHLLVSNSPDRTVLLNNGCLCCEMLNSFKETLADLYHRRAKSEVPPFNRVITETTGLADPAPIVQTVLRDSFVSFYFQLEGVATTVDAALGEIELNEHREAVQQAAFADTIIITKVDLTAGQPPPALHARLRQINPTATITSWHKGGAIPAALLQPGPNPLSSTAPSPGRAWPAGWTSPRRSSATDFSAAKAC
jgi:G3E family GTPase